jgi:hypothetical protein
MKKHIEFSKKIVVWAMMVTTIFLIVSLGGYYILQMAASPELTNMVGLIVTGVIVSYAGKAGVENYQKIKNTNCNTNIE